MQTFVALFKIIISYYFINELLNVSLYLWHVKKFENKKNGSLDFRMNCLPEH